MTRIAMEQTSPSPVALESNRAEIVERCRLAFAAGADIVVFPELAPVAYSVDPALLRTIAEPADGPLVSRIAEAIGGQDRIVALGYCERDGGELYNSVALVGPDGPILNYRKLHLFDAEQTVFSAGDSLPVVQTSWGALGVCICYDLRFVEVLRLLSLRGADIVLAPAAWVDGFDRQQPSTALTRQAEAVLVQANLDQVAVVAVSQVATSVGGAQTLGGSIAVDAYGAVIGGPLSRVDADRALLTIDVAAGRAARERSARIKPRADRRTDVYAVQHGKEAW